MKNQGVLIFSVFASFTLCLYSCGNGTTTDNNSEVEVLDEQNATVELLDSLILEDPRNPDLYYDRALYYHSEGVDPKAASDVYSALHLDSANVSYYMLAGDIFISLGQGEKAIAIMSKGVNMIPGNEELYTKAIEYNFYMRSYESGLTFANELIALNKYNPDAYFFKGLIYQELEQENKAISAFQTCVEVDPTYYNAHIQLALSFSQQKEDIAIQYFENAIALDPGSREAYYGIAYHYQSKGDYKKAIDKYREMIVLDPKDHEIFFNIGHCYIALDSLQKAYRNFDIATEIQPQYAGAYYMKGNISEGLGDNIDALMNYEQALKMLPEDEKIMEAIERVK